MMGSSRPSGLTLTAEERALIHRVDLGEITPEEAERINAAAGRGKLAVSPDPGEWDPMAEDFWTLPMTIAWIAFRRPERVREFWNEFRERSWVWREETEVSYAAVDMSAEDIASVMADPQRKEIMSQNPSMKPVKFKREKRISHFFARAAPPTTEEAEEANRISNRQDTELVFSELQARARAGEIRVQARPTRDGENGENGEISAPGWRDLLDAETEKGTVYLLAGSDRRYSDPIFAVADVLTCFPPVFEPTEVGSPPVATASVVEEVVDREDDPALIDAAGQKGRRALEPKVRKHLESRKARNAPVPSFKDDLKAIRDEFGYISQSRLRMLREETDADRLLKPGRPRKQK